MTTRANPGWFLTVTQLEPLHAEYTDRSGWMHDKNLEVSISLIYVREFLVKVLKAVAVEALAFPGRVLSSGL